MVAGRSEGALHVLVEGSWHIGGSSTTHQCASSHSTEYERLLSYQTSVNMTETQMWTTKVLELDIKVKQNEIIWQLGSNKSLL